VGTGPAAPRCVSSARGRCCLCCLHSRRPGFSRSKGWLLPACPGIVLHPWQTTVPLPGPCRGQNPTGGGCFIDSSDFIQSWWSSHVLPAHRDAPLAAPSWRSRRCWLSSADPSAWPWGRLSSGGFARFQPEGWMSSAELWRRSPEPWTPVHSPVQAWRGDVPAFQDPGSSHKPRGVRQRGLGGRRGQAWGSQTRVRLVAVNMGLMPAPRKTGMKGAQQDRLQGKGSALISSEERRELSALDFCPRQKWILLYSQLHTWVQSNTH